MPTTKKKILEHYYKNCPNKTIYNNEDCEKCRKDTQHLDYLFKNHGSN